MNRSPFHNNLSRSALSRRELLWRSGGGLGGIALAAMMSKDSLAMDVGDSVIASGHPAKAKRVIQLFMAGGASHLDLWDFKPDLVTHHGKPSDFGEPVEAFQDGLGPWLKPVWDFKSYGQSGKKLSDVVAPLGAHVDDMAFIHNMVSKTGIHSQAMLLQNTGFLLPGFPGAGCWVSYALGSINDNLPSFVVLADHRGFASNGVKNWDSAFLPSQYSGSVINPSSDHPIADLQPFIKNDFITSQSESKTHDLLKTLNQDHLYSRSDDPRLEGRIHSYELAAGMQMAAPEALDWRSEPGHVLKMYGLDNIPASWGTEINAAEESYFFSQKCLTARRLLERGVRFVQIWSGNDNGFPRRNWDSHEDLERDHGPLATGMANGVAALMQDLKQHGMLEDTLVLWTTEFGRMPSTQGGKGRDHNPYVFTNWLAGGGIKGGVTAGESDRWGYKPLDRDHATSVYDIHATMLHLLGIDHTKLTVRQGGANRRLTDVHGHVLQEIVS